LCRPAANTDVDQLTKSWNATGREDRGPVRVFDLRDGIGLGVHNRDLVFGDGQREDGMFAHVMKQIAAGNGAPLSSDAAFVALRQRVPQRADGILFVRLGMAAPVVVPTSMPSSQPSGVKRLRARAALPGPFRGASNIMVALQRDHHLLHFTAVGDGKFDAPKRRGDVLAQLNRLPARTLFAWGGYVDFKDLLTAADDLPERSLARVILNLQNQSPSVDRWSSAVGPGACIALGVVPADGGQAIPPIPAMGLIMSSRLPKQAFDAWTETVETALSVYNLLSMSPRFNLPALESVHDERIVDCDARVLDLAPAISRFLDTPSLAGTALCWAMDDDALIVATHRDWLRQMLEARKGRGSTLSDALLITQKPIDVATGTIVLAQTGPIADLCKYWLAHIERTAPYMLEEQWWRQRQPGGAGIHLGISGRERADDKALSIERVSPDGPAAGFIKPGDQIVGVNHGMFATSQPVREFVDGVAARPNARWVDVEIKRAGQRIVVRVPLPFVHPIDVLRRLVAIGGITQRVVYHDDAPSKEGPRGFVTIELRDNDRPTFDFSPPAAPQPVGTNESDGS
jgi:hypothetical protein